MDINDLEDRLNVLLDEIPYWMLKDGELDDIYESFIELISQVEILIEKKQN